MSTSYLSPNIIDSRTFTPRNNEMWPAHIVKAAAITEAVETLKLGAAGSNGRREGLIAHPASREPGIGLAPSTAVSFGVLLPGEKTQPRRTNASTFSLGIEGSAVAYVDGREFIITKWDGWNTPGMRIEVLENKTDKPFIYVTYSNAPFLQKLEVFYEEYNPPEASHISLTPEFAEKSAKRARAKDMAGKPRVVGDTGAMLLPYEHLIDPDFVESRALHWRWDDVAPHMGLVRSLSQGYNGRPLWCLYNSATGSRNGTTFSFFATMTSAAPNFIGPVHRHVSSAINLILEGSGWSIVNGERIEWEAGDIMLSAPGWSPHGHAFGPQGAIVLTIQDHPLHIGAESLIWQEDLKNGPILSLGAQAGFETNISEFRKAE